MKIENEIRAEIFKLEKDYAHVLEGGLARIQINAPRALMQIEAVSRLSALYWVLGEKRPLYDFEKKK